MSINSDPINIVLKLFPLPELDEEPLKSNFEMDMSEFSARQLFSTGFNYYLHQSYELFDDEIKKQGPKIFYWVINNFEVLLTDQDKKYELINNIKLYLDIKDTTLVENRLFFHFWEMNMIFKIGKNAKINLLTKNDNNKKIVEFSINKYVERMNDLLKSINQISYTNKSFDFGILLLDNPKTLLDVESNYFKNMLTNTFVLLKDLNDDGKIIIELDDTFTEPTIKYLYLLKSLFKKVAIYKPYYSRSTDSNKYLVCEKFNSKKFKKIYPKLEISINTMNGLNNMFVINFMNDIKIPNKLLSVIRFINVYLSGIQHKQKNKILTYIRSENYFGPEYLDYLDKQLQATQYFMSKFMPLDVNDNTSIARDLKNDIDNNINKMTEYNSTLSLTL
jgi:hypothetical protein